MKSVTSLATSREKRMSGQSRDVFREWESNRETPEHSERADAHDDVALTPEMPCSTSRQVEYGSLLMVQVIGSSATVASTATDAIDETLCGAPTLPSVPRKLRELLIDDSLQEQEQERGHSLRRWWSRLRTEL